MAPLTKTSSDSKRDDRREKKPVSKSFRAVLGEELDRRSDDEIYLYSYGYTNKAVPMATYIYMRDYTHQGRRQA